MCDVRHSIALALGCCFATQIVNAQQLSLPSVDGITAFYRIGRMSGSSPWRATPTAPCPKGASAFPLCGWGFETVHDLTGERKGSQWGAELAVGYDFLTLSAMPRSGNNFEIRGTI